jgi:predicted esterase
VTGSVHTALALLAMLPGVALAAPLPLAAPYETVSLAPAQLTDRLNRFEEGQWLATYGRVPRCTVRVFHHEYRTVDGRGRPTTASSALMVPGGDAPGCSGPRPLVLALHGTVTEQRYNLADLSGNNPASPRALSWAAIYAAQGYIVVAPNYAGFDTSKLDYHPYLDVKQQSRDVSDALAAARRLLAQAGGRDGGKLFITGYSQGGWMAMAMHRALEAQGQRVTASMPASGAYALAAVADDIFMGRPIQGSTLYFPLGVRAFQRAYGDIYRRPDEVFNARLGDGVAVLLPSAAPFAQLVSEGKVPATALFDSAPLSLPADASPALRALFARMGPQHGPASHRVTNALGYGSNALLNSGLRLAWLHDMAKHPDGAWPDFGSGRVARGSGHPFRRAFIRNDLRSGWVPKTPLIMCGGSGDQSVPFHLGAALMMRYWSGSGMAVPPGRVGMIDFDAPPGPGEAHAALKANLAEMRSRIVPARGEQAWLDLYHQYTLPRFCYTAARDWFDGM